MVLKNNKTIILIILTILIVVLLVGIIFVVDKVDKNKSKKDYFDIQDTIEVKNYIFKVSNLNIKEEEQDIMNMVITIELNAKKDLLIVDIIKDFSVNDYSLYSYECEKQNIEKNNSTIIYLQYRVNRNNTQLYLKNKTNYVRLGCALI